MTVPLRVSEAGGDSGSPQEVLWVYDLTITCREHLRKVAVNGAVLPVTRLLSCSRRQKQFSLTVIFWSVSPCFEPFKLNLPSILPQGVSSLGEDADEELSGLVRSVGGRHDDVVTRVQMQLPPHTPGWRQFMCVMAATIRAMSNNSYCYICLMDYFCSYIYVYFFGTSSQMNFLIWIPQPHNKNNFFRQVSQIKYSDIRSFELC